MVPVVSGRSPFHILPTGDTQSYPAAPLLLLLSTDGLLLAYHMILIGSPNLNKPSEPLSIQGVRGGKGKFLLYYRTQGKVMFSQACVSHSVHNRPHSYSVTAHHCYCAVGAHPTGMFSCFYLQS